MAESAQAFQWIQTTCTGDGALMAAATGGVVQGFANIGTNPPYVSFGQQAGSDVLTATAVRLWARLIMQIVAIGPNSNYVALVTIANRLDALFGRVGPVALSPGVMLSCNRDIPIALEEPKLINGAAWSRLGGLFTIQLQGS